MRLLPLCLILAAAPAFAAPSPKPAEDANKPICKRQVEIGTLVGRRKVCKTRAEWAAEMRQAQEDTRLMQTPSATNGPGGI